VLLLRKSGAHLHSDERPAAELLARRHPGIWGLAGIDGENSRELEEENGGARRVMAGSAP